MELHSLPFSIAFNGEAEVDSAFPFNIDKHSNNAESAFRGRKLVGQIHELPSNLSVAIGKIDKLKGIILIERNEKEVKTIIEWNKADVPEPTKIDLVNFDRLSFLQSKVLENCVYII